MRGLAALAACVLLSAIPAEAARPKRRAPVQRVLMSDAEVRAQIIKTSIAIYPGDCACPYSVTARGRQCGRKSVWSRHGDFAATCYPNEVSKGEIREWRVRHRQVPFPQGRSFAW